MAGCRALTDEEVELVSKSFGGTYARRDRALFLTGVYTGYRISELLSLTVGDLWQHDKVVDTVTVARRHMKGKQQSRTMRVHPIAQAALHAWIETIPPPRSASTYLFRSRKGANQPLRIWQAAAILREAFQANGLEGRLGTHSMRKTFAAKIYRLHRDMNRLRVTLGHARVTTTQDYLASVTDEEIFADVMHL